MQSLLLVSSLLLSIYMRGTPHTHPCSSHALGHSSLCLRYNSLLNTLSLFPGCFYQLSGTLFTLRYSLYTQRKSLLIIRSYAFANALFNSLLTHFLLLNLLYLLPTRFFSTLAPRNASIYFFATPLTS